ncbi:uncharacterized protein LOC134656071 [Cydia amplana]|uniref:uncharacterized protein LOC134656071 n=1 Tax=Cydia amplana TaxID=1869771 RepID=UPI002FE6AFC4
MKKICFVLLVTIIHYVAAMFEYGEHKIGEVFSYKLAGTIPPLVPIHRINITHGRDDLDEHYTHLNVATLSETSYNPNIIFDSQNNMLTFFIRYPLHTISFRVTGYSMPLKDYTGPVNYETTTPDMSNDLILYPMLPAPTDKIKKQH